MARTATLTHVPISPLDPGRFKTVLTEERFRELEESLERAREILSGRAVWNVNSTAAGGGVAEMLASLIAYARGARVDARWAVISGEPDFYKVTKRIHNMLHGSSGDGGGLGPEDDRIYRETAVANADEFAKVVRPGDIVLLHDPQTAGLGERVRELGARVIWRCHVGVDHAGDVERDAWRFLAPHVRHAEIYIFSRRAFFWDELEPERLVIVAPSIDAFSAKNQDLTPEAVTAILRRSGMEDGSTQDQPVFQRQDGTPGRVDRQADLNGGRPIPVGAPVLLQVSRWDRLKDHEGVMDAFKERISQQNADAHLVLVGPAVAAVTDDPEGLQVLQDMQARWADSPPELRDRMHLVSLPMEDLEENAAMVNAIQRRADVVTQKSIAEGFGLTVAEAMWKGRPVIGSAVGGIQDQIRPGETGMLVEPRDLRGFAEAALGLFADPAQARAIGLRAREEVRDEFLGARHLGQYVELFGSMLAAIPAGA
jgi:trehalose synthase